MPNESEELKHRYRVREILLDKGILAVVLALLVFFANARLAEYKTALDSRLDELRASRERQRVIAEREVTAYENIWKALIHFRRTLEPLSEEPLQGATADAVRSAILDFEQALAADSIYLADPLRAHLMGFVEGTFPEAYVDWELAPDAKLRPGVWNGLTTEMDAIGEEIRATIYRPKRLTGNPTGKPTGEP